MKARSDHKQQTLTSLFMNSQESDPPTQSELLTYENAGNNEKSSPKSEGPPLRSCDENRRGFGPGRLKIKRIQVTLV